MSENGERALCLLADALATGGEGPEAQAARERVGAQVQPAREDSMYSLVRCSGACRTGFIVEGSGQQFGLELNETANRCTNPAVMQNPQLAEATRGDTLAEVDLGNVARSRVARALSRVGWD